MTSFLIFFLWSNFVAIGIERIGLLPRRVPVGFALAGFFVLLDESSLAALVDVNGSTFAAASNKFVTFWSGTLVFNF